MFRITHRGLAYSLLFTAMLSTTGCATGSMWGNRGCTSCDSGCATGSCSTGGCSDGMMSDGCTSCGKKSKFPKFDGLSKKCDSCSTGCDSGCDDCGKKSKKLSKCGGMCSFCSQRSLAIQEEYPVGAVERAHFHQMQTNGEAADFILHRKDFVLSSAELTPDGKDKILEIAARMRSAPFPVIVERSENNSDPELDAHRRALIAQILTDCGNPDANNRTFVSPAYGLGKHAL
ncbi:MAG: hypothetical protein Q8K78_02285, partial [Planctomycetaceae bacterium]|nr:hypothetical protein [Planctomycetaceae bacterium]